MYKQSLSQK